MLTLAGKLLCASHLTYCIDASGHMPNEQPWYDAVGFLSPPACFTSGLGKIDACLVGTSNDGVILAFRGTLPLTSPNHRQVILDWANDLEALLVKGKDLPGLVHEGFLESLDDLWPALRTEVKRQLAAAPGKPLYITGHSKGGGVANLAAARFVATDQLKSCVCTFAAAHCADAVFAEWYAGNVTDCSRYEYADDIVPHLPPGEIFAGYLNRLPWLGKLFKTLGYAPVGTLHFIDWEGNVHDDIPQFLDLKRFVHMLELLVELKFHEIIHDHAIDDPNSGYMKAIIPAGLG